MGEIRTIDLFCGAGGSSWGARLAGVQIVAGFDAWRTAGSVYQDNFPEAAFFESRLEDLDPQQTAAKLGDIDLLLASPECTNHSPAKGNRPRCEQSKETAFQVTRFAQILDPRWIVVENVVSMRNWSRYDEFLDDLTDLGYHVLEQTLTATDFGVPQKRRRLFLLCDRERSPVAPKGRSSKPKPASGIVEMNGTYDYSPLRTKRRAKATIARAERAIAALGNKTPFLLVYYGSDHAGGWQSLDAPLRTITTLDRFGLVKPGPKGHVMRMLQVPELKKAMSMPQRFRIRHGTRREKIHMIGNAVCPTVMRRVIRSIVGSTAGVIR